MVSRLFTAALCAVSACSVGALGAGCHRSQIAQKTIQPASKQAPQKQRLKGEIVRSARIRDPFPIRMGMVTTRGLGDTGSDDIDAAGTNVQLGANLETWLATHCDVLALDASAITPQTFPRMRSLQKLFTPLLFTYASTIYEQPGHRGSVGIYSPTMSAWELKTLSGSVIKHPDAGGHWMDPGNADWANYYAKNAEALARNYHSDGVIAAELGPANTFVDYKDTKYSSFPKLVDATASFLQIVHKPKQFLIVPSSAGYDTLIGRPTLPVHHARTEPQLSGRSWDELDRMTDGFWAEGWVRPYWTVADVPENFWEMHEEAADRAGRMPDNVLTADIFIAAYAYHDAQELEYGLASYLLASHMQSRLVFQPMPQYPGEPANAGMSARVMRREFERYKQYFDAPLGIALQERHEVVLNGNSVWRRRFQNGDVYLNSHDQGNCLVSLAAPMMTLDGQQVKTFELGPHTAKILYNQLPADQKSN